MLITKAAPLQVKLLAAACAFSLAAVAVSWYGNSRYDAGHVDGLKVGRGELAVYRQQVAEQKSRDAAAATLRYQTLANSLLATSNRLAVTGGLLNTLRDQLNRRLPNAAQAPTSLPGQPADGLLSVSGLQFYNDALGVSPLPAGREATSTVQSGTENTAAGATDSGVLREDLLAHAADYGHWCRELAAQRDALIDAYQQGGNDGQQPH
ncbi:hypothetical protein [Gulbenkiania mobilis]|uniref:hypothetical protein n=1 Tax=Gulbenkiania mobilis TaxID=397457 RepID=UPI0006BBA5D9|nr:hypothetical protein [Gulbenkiania mobilis]